MIDELSNALFENLNIVIIVGIIALMVWVYLYVVEYSDWFKNLKKKPKPKQSTLNVLGYFKVRVQYLIENTSKVPSKEILIEMDTIARYYLSIIKNIRILPGDTIEEIATKIKKPDNHSKLLLDILDRFELLKHHNSIKLSHTQMKNYLVFLSKILNHRSVNPEDVKELDNEIGSTVD